MCEAEGFASSLWKSSKRSCRRRPILISSAAAFSIRPRLSFFFGSFFFLSSAQKLLLLERGVEILPTTSDSFPLVGKGCGDPAAADRWHRNGRADADRSRRSAFDPDVHIPIRDTAPD